MNKTAFIGHRNVYPDKKVTERLEAAVSEQIQNGCRHFVMGTHGAFDALALSCCKKARIDHPDIEIDVVITSYHKIEKKAELDFSPYQDVTTLMYDIEDEHFKRQILVSNQMMVEDCNTLICYVDERRKSSGAKTALIYAEKCGLRIINLYRKDDFPG